MTMSEIALHPRKSRFLLEGELAHWRDFAHFKEVEAERRGPNRADITTDRLFLSHSWRNAAEQIRKRRIIAAMSRPRAEGGPGMAYWADFLDLQRKGPVEWQRVIEQGIDDCSKVICFVDGAYLMSYNCLKEVAYAMQHGKPVAVIIMDMEAWNLLTMPSGAAEAWESEAWGLALKSNEGSDFPSEQPNVDLPFSKEILASLFEKISHINFCPARAIDEQNMGIDELIDNVLDYVSADIEYMKDQAKLKSMSSLWIENRRSMAMLLSAAEAHRWQQWIHFTEKSGMVPAPTEEMKEFVICSVRAAKMRFRILVGTGVALMSLIVAGIIISLVMWARAARAEEAAHSNEHAAALWTMLGKISEPSGSVSEIRALLSVIELASAFKGDNNNYHSIRAEAANVFYKIMGCRSINVGMINGLNKARALEWSPDGSVLAISPEMPDNPILLQPIGEDMNAQLWLPGHESSVRGMAWAANGLLAAIDGTGTVRLWDVAGNSSVKLAAPLVDASSRLSVDWLNATHIVATGDSDGSLHVWNVSDPTMPLTAIPGSCYDFASNIKVSPLTDLVAVSYGYCMTVALMRASDITSNATFVPSDAVFTAPYVSFPDKNPTLYVSDSRKVKVFNVRRPMSIANAPSPCWDSCRVFDTVEEAWGDSVWETSGLVHRELSYNQKELLGLLGWNATSWRVCAECRKNRWSHNITDCIWHLYIHSHVCPISQLQSWQHLSDMEHLAATHLGFTAATWDSTSPTSCCYAESKNVLRLLSNAFGAEFMARPVPSTDGVADVKAAAIIEQEGDTPQLVFASEVAPSGNYLAAGLEQGAVVFDLRGRHSARQVSLPGTQISQLSWSHDSRYLACGWDTGVTTIWDWGAARRPRMRALPQFRADITAVAFDPSQGSNLVAGSSDGMLLIHDLDIEGGTPRVLSLGDGAFYVNNIAYAPFGQVVAIASTDLNTASGMFSMCDISTEICNHTNYEFTGVNCVDWSHDGDLIAMALEPDQVVVWDFSTMAMGEPMWTFTTAEYSMQVSISPDGKLLAAASMPYELNVLNFFVFDLGTGEKIELDFSNGDVQPFGMQLSALRFSPIVDDGIYTLAVGNGEGEMYLATGTFSQGSKLDIEMFHKHRDIIYRLDWSMDAVHLASASGDGNLHLWEPARPEVMANPRRLTVAPDSQPCLFVAFAPNESTVAVSGGLGFVKIVPITTVADMPAALTSILMPFTRTSFEEEDAIFLKIPASVFETLYGSSMQEMDR